MKDMNTKNRISVYVCDSSLLNDENTYKKIYASVSQRRRDKTDGLRFRADKNLSLSAEYLLMCACRDYGIGYGAETICTGEHSKPYFTYSGARFNLSHSGERAMCVMSDVPGMEVGCDVERIHGYQPKLAGRFFSEEEQKLLASCNTDELREEMFYRIWTLRESFMKCTGLGMQLPMKSFSVTDGDNWKIITKDGCPDIVSGGKYDMLEYGRDDGYRYAVCVQNGFIGMQGSSECTYRTDEGITVYRMMS